MVWTDDLAGVIEQIASILSIQPTSLIWPGILTNLIIPMVFNTAGIYYFLTKGLRLFAYSTWINIILGLIIAFLALPFGWITSIISIGMITAIGIQERYNKVIFLVVMFFLYSLLFLGIQPFFFLASIGLIALMTGFRIHIWTWRIVFWIMSATILYYLSPYIMSIPALLSLT